MNASGKVIIVSAQDGKEIVAAIKSLLKDEPVTLNEWANDPVETWEAVVILFVLTPSLIGEPSFVEYARQMTEIDVPVVPVVEDLLNFSFKSIPQGMTVFRDRNVVGITARTGPTLLETVRGYLGLASFSHAKKVFISYRRSDGQRQADELYAYLWKHHFQVFMDQHQIEGGVVVQERIKKEIIDKDLILLIDSPEAASSEWVRAEVTEAVSFRIPVCAVSTTDYFSFPIFPEMKYVVWDADRPDNLERIRLMISRCAASRELTDSRVLRTIRKFAGLKNIRLQEIEQRRMLISSRGKRFVLEYEDSAISLERLHRLYKGYKQLRRCKGALFVGGDHPILPPTQDAVAWARGKTSLEVVPLTELYSVLDQLFT